MNWGIIAIIFLVLITLWLHSKFQEDIKELEKRIRKLERNK
jgi:flagellar biogenesis protein FliO